jgi:hypothetical protein
MIESTESFTGVVGILLQLAAVLVGGLFFLLRAPAARRRCPQLCSLAWKLARSPGTPAA